MAIFGYLVWVCNLYNVDFSTLALMVAAKAFDDTEGWFGLSCYW